MIPVSDTAGGGGGQVPSASLLHNRLKPFILPIYNLPSISRTVIFSCVGFNFSHFQTLVNCETIKSVYACSLLVCTICIILPVFFFVC